MTARFVRVIAMIAAVTCAASCSAAANQAASTETSPFPDTNVPLAQALDVRLEQARTAALDRGAEASIAVFDRTTNNYLEVGGDQQIETASVAKLFIAEDLLYQDSRDERPFGDDDRALMVAMLESSDDTAANLLWDAAGGSDLVNRVAQRYSLTSTTAPYDGLWWNTETTARDLITFYDGVLDDTAGLGADRINLIVDHLRESTATAADGYDQRFGLPDALFNEPVLAVKQGWMCCVSDQWVHLTTGIVGEDNRFIVTVTTREDIQYQDDDNYGLIPDTSMTDATNDESALHARDTITGVAQIIFPDGTVDEWSPSTPTTEKPVQEASGP